MKTWRIFIGLSLCVVYNTSAQPCKKITIDDVSHKKILTDYIRSAEVNREGFAGDKGVVVVIRYFRDGRPAWLISTTIEDSYKDNPPVEWTSLERDIVLFYDSQSSTIDVTKYKPTPELLRCLDEAIGDRLYIRPPVRERLLNTGFKTPSGKPIIINARRLFGGNGNNSIIIVFEADGSITKYHPV